MSATVYTVQVQERGKWVNRQMTAADYRAYLDARKPYAAAIMDAFRRNDLQGCARTQVAMRQRFA